MKTLIITLLLSCSIAHAQHWHDPLFNSHKEPLKPNPNISQMLDMHNAYQWGKLQNQLAAEAPPIRYDFTVRQAPNWDKNGVNNSAFVPNPAYSGSLQDLARVLAQEPIKLKDSPFNDSFMLGVKP